MSRTVSGDGSQCIITGGPCENCNVLRDISMADLDHCRYLVQGGTETSLSTLTSASRLPLVLTFTDFSTENSDSEIDLSC